MPESAAPDATATTAPVSTPTTPVTVTPAPSTETTQTPAGDAGDLWADPVKAKAEIERLRRENGADRVNAKTAAAKEARDEITQTLGKALGLITDGDGAPSVEDLTRQADADKARVRDLTVRLALAESGAKPLARAAILGDGILTDLDHTAADYADQVKAKVGEYLTKYPELKTAQVAGASSVDHAGGSGEGAVSKEQFAAMNPAEKNALFTTNPTLYRTLTGR